VSTAEEKREHRRLEILQAAKQVFAERGFHAASVNEVIKTAGIARGTFYLYFSSKDAVFESILDLAIQELEARIIGVDTEEGAAPPALQLHQNVSRVLQYMLADRELIKLILNHGLPPDADLALRVESFFNHVEERIESSLTQGMTMGLVRSCDASLTASLILGSVRGALRRLIKGEEKFDIPVVATQLIDFSLRGVISSGGLVRQNP
jgi:AcrR family transcriptional regulator